MTADCLEMALKHALEKKNVSYIIDQLMLFKNDITHIQFNKILQLAGDQNGPIFSYHLATKITEQFNLGFDSHISTILLKYP